MKKKKKIEKNETCVRGIESQIVYYRSILAARKGVIPKL